MICHLKSWTWCSSNNFQSIFVCAWHLQKVYLLNIAFCTWMVGNTNTKYVFPYLLQPMVPLFHFLLCSLSMENRDAFSLIDKTDLSNTLSTFISVSSCKKGHCTKTYCATCNNEESPCSFSLILSWCPLHHHDPLTAQLRDFVRELRTSCLPCRSDLGSFLTPLKQGRVNRP